MVDEITAADPGGANPADPADPGGAPKGADPAPAEPKALSVRAQLAQTLDEGERGDFEKWANQYPTDAEFAKAARNMRGEFDRRVPIPGEDAKPEDRAKFFQKLGMPKEPGEYSFDWGKDENDKPVELKDDELAQFEAFRKTAHEHNLTQRQFEAMIATRNAHIEQDGIRAEEMTGKLQDQTIETMKREWGLDYEDNLIAASEAGATFSDDPQAWSDFSNLKLQGGMKVGDHPTLLKVMARIGRSVEEDVRVNKMHSSGEATDVQAEISRLETEAYEKGSSPTQEPYHSKLTKLYEKLHPKTTTIGKGHTGGFGVR
jgi:hypothetical protein